MARGRKRFKRSDLNSLPQVGKPVDFYRKLKVTKPAMWNWMTELGLASHMTAKGERIILKSDLINWMEHQGRIDD